MKELVRFHIKERDSLTRPGSSKETFHISLESLEGFPSFKVGDAIAICAENDPQTVEEILHNLSLPGDLIIIHPKKQISMPLRTFLLLEANLQKPSKALLQTLGVESKDPLDLIYLLSLHPSWRPQGQELANLLSPLLPRFYSIASSPLFHEKEIHLTVALTSYEINGYKRPGVASHFLCKRAEPQKTSFTGYIQPTRHFTLPTQDTPIIMIGPGTGVAPFRAFLQEREVLKTASKSWLFFGERMRAFDFFYEDFFSSLVEKNKLRLDLAFSRDQEEKVYVQHKMKEQGEELCEWIKEGATLYVCGDADPMAKEVEKTLIHLFQTHFGHSLEEAVGYLSHLRQKKQYLADVY